MNSKLNGSQNKLLPLTEYLSPAREHLASRTTEPELSMHSMPKFNRIIWGLHRQELMVLAARPGVGKSAISLQIAHDLAKAGKPVLFLSLEMSLNTILERLFCQHCHVNNEELTAGMFGDYIEEWNGFKDHIQSVPLGVSDCIGRTWEEIDTAISRLTTKPALIVLDYVNLVRTRSVNRKTDIDEFVKHFRAMAIRENICGLLLCQINRQGAENPDQIPHMGNLKDSGTLEEHSDAVMILHRDKENKYMLLIEKNRQGRVGKAFLTFHPQYYTFSDPSVDVLDLPKKQ